MLWALEYDPNLYAVYEKSGECVEKDQKSKGKARSFRQYGKYKRDSVKNGATDDHLSISIFVVTSVLNYKSPTLLKEARGLDDIVKVHVLCYSIALHSSNAICQ